MDPMLRKALRKHNGLRQQLDNMLLGEQGDVVEAELKKFLTKRPCWIPVTEKPKPQPTVFILTIDRTHYPFNPETFIGKGWSFWRGPADSNGLEGDLEQDEKSLALIKVNPSEILLETQLCPGESYTTGEERLKRLISADRIRLDLGVFKSLWQDQSMIPESWKGKTTFFDGQTLRGPGGDRYALYLCWYGGRWGWFVYWLSSRRNVAYPSAVLAK